MIESLVSYDLNIEVQDTCHYDCSILDILVCFGNSPKDDCFTSNEAWVHISYGFTSVLMNTEHRLTRQL